MIRNESKEGGQYNYSETLCNSFTVFDSIFSLSD